MFRIATSISQTSKSEHLDKNLLETYGYVIDGYRDSTGVITLVPLPKPKERIISKVPTINHYFVPDSFPAIEKAAFIREILLDESLEIEALSLATPFFPEVILKSKTNLAIFKKTSIPKILEIHNFFIIGIPSLQAIMDTTGIYHFEKPNCVKCDDEAFERALMLLLGKPSWAQIYI